MPKPPERTYPRAVLAASGVGVGTVAWTWAGGLPTRRRRLVRLAIAAAMVASPGPSTRRPAARPAAEADPRPGEPDLAPAAAVTAPAHAAAPLDGPAPNPVPTAADSRVVVGGRQRIAVLIGAALLSSVVVPAASRRLQRRWLRRLERAGHAHPHRSVALRMGLFAFASELTRELARTRSTRSATGHGG